MRDYENHYKNCYKNRYKNRYEIVVEGVEGDVLKRMIKGTVSSKKGFYLGDSCYVLSDKIYYDFWGDQKDFADGVFKFKEFHFAVGATKYGDGCYEDDDGNNYPVDSGTIALIPLELVGNKDRLELGNVFDIPGEAEFAYEDGVFDIVFPDGYEIHIDTNNVNNADNVNNVNNVEDDAEENISEDDSKDNTAVCNEDGWEEYCEDCDEDCAYCDYYDECEHRSFLEAYAGDEIDGYYHNDPWDDDYEE